MSIQKTFSIELRDEKIFFHEFAGFENHLFCRSLRVRTGLTIHDVGKLVYTK